MLSVLRLAQLVGGYGNAEEQPEHRSNCQTMRSRTVIAVLFSLSSHGWLVAINLGEFEGQSPSVDNFDLSKQLQP